VKLNKNSTVTSYKTQYCKLKQEQDCHTCDAICGEGGGAVSGTGFGNSPKMEWTDISGNEDVELTPS